MFLIVIVKSALGGLQSSVTGTDWQYRISVPCEKLDKSGGIEMTNRIVDQSPRKTARIVGFLYLMFIAKEA
jgi:hypothetical protein